MKIRFEHIVFILFLLSMAGHGTAQENAAYVRTQEELLARDPDDTSALERLMFHHLHKADYRKAIDYGERLLDIGYARQDYHRSVLYAHIGLGQAYTMLGDSIAAYNHLGQARINAENAQNDSALCSVYNGLGLYAYNLENDPYSALHYFFLGLDAAQRSQYEKLRAILLANIANVYYIQRDTVGLKYSLQTYELGHQQSSPYLIYIGALTSAYMYFLQGKYEQTLDYVKEAEFLMQQNGFYDQGLVYAIYGMTVAELGDTRQAVKLFRKGLETAETNQPSTQVFLLYGYAHALGREGRYDEAVTLLQQALALTDGNHFRVFRHDVVNELSIAYERMGRYADALACMRSLSAETDSLFSISKEKVISDLRIQYDSEHMENELQQRRLELLQREKKEQLLLGVLVILVLIAGGTFYLYRHKNRLYLTIVRQKQESLRREQQLQDTIRRMNEGNIFPSPSVAEDAEKKYVNSPLTDEKKHVLFQNLEHCMTDQGIYRDKLLTKEKVADLLGTNRTYLSQVINEQTGQTFTQYVNRYRLDEAIRLLGDPQADITLKGIASDVGFSSMTTFYKVFQTNVGMSPKEYREKALHLSSGTDEAD